MGGGGGGVVAPTNLKKCVMLNGNFQRGGIVFSGELNTVGTDIYIIQCGGTRKTFLQTCIPQAIYLLRLCCGSALTALHRASFKLFLQCSGLSNLHT